MRKGTYLVKCFTADTERHDICFSRDSLKTDQNISFVWKTSCSYIDGVSVGTPAIVKSFFKFPKLRGTHFFAIFEDVIEMRNCFKAAYFGYIFNCCVGFCQNPFGFFDSEIIYVFYNCSSCYIFKIPAKMIFTKIKTC